MKLGGESQKLVSHMKRTYEENTAANYKNNLKPFFTYIHN